MNAAHFVDDACRFADISRDLIRQEINRPRQVSVKSDATPVTPVDQRVERALRTAIEKTFPEHGIVGEEYDDVPTKSDYIWVLDPIDGTRAFVAGLPMFGTLIALTRKGVPILGVMDSPYTQERWVGVDEAGTTLNGRTIQTRPCSSLGEALTHTSSPLYFETDNDIAAHERTKNSIASLIYGAGCHAFGRVADGYIDIAFETAHDIHDYLALVPIINNAGGVISDWQGAPLTLSSGSRFVATGDRALHSQVVEMLDG